MGEEEEEEGAWVTEEEEMEIQIQAMEEDTGCPNTPSTHRNHPSPNTT
jgi:hypothetical protein